MKVAPWLVSRSPLDGIIQGKIFYYEEINMMVVQMSRIKGDLREIVSTLPQRRLMFKSAPASVRDLVLLNNSVMSHRIFWRNISFFVPLYVETTR